MLKLPLITRTLLASYLTLGVDPDPDNVPDPDPAAAGAGGAGAADDPDGDLGDLDLDGDDPDAGAGGEGGEEDHGALLRAATERAEKAEREAREAREEAQRARGGGGAGAQPGAQPNDEQRLYEEEERKLRDAATTEMERWQINSNRTLRKNAADSRQALYESREAADRTAYDRLCAEKPIAKKYAKRVDDKLAEMRKQGFNLERKLVLKMLIGDDIVEGKVQTKRKPGADAGAGSGTQRADRGTPAHARGDVRARGGGASERDKRKARLENQII